MRKLLIILAVFGLIIALSACGKTAGDRANQTIQTQNPSETTPKTSSTANPSESDAASTTTSNAKPSAPNSTATTTQTQSITREKAIDLALQAAGLTREAVYDVEAELDREREGLFWEVDFETREHEYSYDIHAVNGTVAKVEREIND